MIHALLELDFRLFELINGSWHHPWLDWLFPWWREKLTWVPFYLLLAGFSAVKFRLKALGFILALILSVGLADTVSSKFLKPAVHRLRPCNTPELKEEVRLLTGCGKAYSFTSSHAANHFAVAAFLSLTLGLWYPGWRLWLYLWAGSISYGQVYVGVHFPSDVLGGAFIGFIIGNIVAKMYLRIPKLRIPLPARV
ncbi:MAG: hypothetical protein KIPDCIKN_02563 [Haliscomenobacter sp.]|jgi:membrane-associated phospholipid phosphatase|nr:hypothetical protein [Haliscomenobacter sp.]